MIRILLFLLAFAALAAPARADDISVAGRSVVRVVVVAFEDGEIVDFGHGSGFAVAPDRIVTNAHVVALAARYPQQTAVGIVPSEGSRSYGARIVAFDPARDLALLEAAEGGLPPIPLFTGPLEDGSTVAALGFPGNVDLATASSASDYITPLPPTRSVGIFSNLRPINGIATLLHTASIARGHSGGPLLDPCGRVLGVNTLITRADEGDSPFFFAVANRELTAFLRAARQPFQAVAGECVSMADRLRQDEELTEAEERARQAALAARARESDEARQRALLAIEQSRETRLAVAALLLVLSLVAFGGGGIMLVKDRQQPAILLGAGGALLLIGAVAVFLTRPGLDDLSEEPAQGEAAAAERPEAAFAGRNTCRLVPERSRVTVSSAEEVALDWSPQGCVNGRTQYARNGEVWTRVLVPESEQAVSVLEVRPGEREYVVTRYLLGAEAMERIRALRREVDVKACTADEEARTVLADQLREVRAVLPRLPNERLVYRCESASPEPAS